MQDSDQCPGVLVVHLDKKVTCSIPDCHVLGIFPDVMPGHHMFVTCNEMFVVDECPRCQRGGHVSPRSSPTNRL